MKRLCILILLFKKESNQLKLKSEQLKSNRTLQDLFVPFTVSEIPINGSQDRAPTLNGAPRVPRWTYHMVSSWNLCGDSLNKTAVAAPSCCSTLGGAVPEFFRTWLVLYTLFYVSLILLTGLDIFWPHSAFIIIFIAARTMITHGSDLYDGSLAKGEVRAYPKTCSKRSSLLAFRFY